MFALVSTGCQTEPEQKLQKRPAPALYSSIYLARGDVRITLASTVALVVVKTATTEMAV